MKFKSEELLAELINQTKENIKKAKELQKLDLSVLQKRKDTESWNALECFEHLNMYGAFYLPEITSRMESASYPKNEIFKSGMIGNYFTKSLLPKKKLNKMKTLQATNPLHKDLDASVITVFLNQQSKLLQLLAKAKSKDLTKIKTAISISELIKLRLGDTFRVLIYHNIRHIMQAEDTVK
ncbi:DinB family protein [Aureivirga marina]|uniref:DinB family protein n=1 Tax=Aureivirga marina TaxID=1182451 RepID=UPI0018CAD258|nr:DinB family protein [Aureivirga marina]